MKSRIFPSVMAKNQKELNALLKKLQGSAEHLHLDIADGKFVPSRSLWFKFRLSSKFKYNAHLMINNPENWIKKYGKKVNLVIPQFETIQDVDKYVSRMKKVAFAIKPETSISKLKPYLQHIDYVLVLTVHPGFYGAKFLKSPLKKIKQIKKINPKVRVIVDGGMNPKTIKSALKAGADYFVSGSFVSRSDNPKEAVGKLQDLLNGPKYVSFGALKRRSGRRLDKLFLKIPKPPKKEEYLSLKEMKERLRKKRK